MKTTRVMNSNQQNGLKRLEKEKKFPLLTVVNFLPQSTLESALSWIGQ